MRLDGSIRGETYGGGTGMAREEREEKKEGC